MNDKQTLVEFFFQNVIFLVDMKENRREGVKHDYAINQVCGYH
jgi:hypothetical protein